MKTLARIVFLLVCAVWFIYFSVKQATAPFSISGDEYIKISIKGRIDSIYRYDRGRPVVSINKRIITLAVPGVCGKYLAVNDSIVKYPNIRLVNTYRFYKTYTESILWGSKDNGFDADYNGVISSNRIYKK